jgi:hypothetical protein
METLVAQVQEEVVVQEVWAQQRRVQLEEMDNHSLVLLVLLYRQKYQHQMFL